ncbi:hypothetical protein ACMZ6Z_09240 [Streptococcus pluranimalium]|uniref:hypothetical protein n=1 Tax=Streptococcus pluranimalium TaxID=82348 RepID=UPI0039FBD7D0
MKCIKVSFEYKCFPLWIYDESGDFLDNDLPVELVNDNELDKKLRALQSVYDGLFINESKLFKFNGFADRKAEEQFYKEIDIIVRELREKVGRAYEIIVKNVI